jgi:ribosomal protein S6--L-glutamate ligase
MRRHSAPGDFRSNLHRGGRAQAIRLSPSERSTAVRAAKAMGLSVAGVDLLQSDEGPMVLEVNSSPGLEGIEEASGVDIADLMIEYIEDNVGA